MNLVSIDPSLRGSGVAYWRDGQLVTTHLFQAGGKQSRRAWGECARDIARGARAWPPVESTHLVCEIPQIYKQSPGDPNDLVAVSLVAGALCHAYPAQKIVTVVPAEWKGQVPKQVHHPRIWGNLNAAEADILKVAQDKVGRDFHNVMDAVGLGLWYLKKSGVR